MKSTTFLLAAAIFLLSCNNQRNQAKLTKADSLSIYNVIKNSSYDTIKRPFFSTPKVEDAPKTEKEVRDMHLAYLEHPLEIYWKDDVTGATYKVRGFNIPRNDLDILYKKGVNGARIYLGFKDGEYKLIMAAVNSDNGNHFVTGTDLEVFDDFFPCPTYCPQSGGATEIAKKSDLNWDGAVFRIPK
jgi:hypothetical protein